jgi:hypothetical protein
MSLNKKLFSLCPIPEEQKPINQYIDLKENSFLQWIFLTKKKYQKKFVFFYLFTFVILFYFRFTVLIPEKFHFFMENTRINSFFFLIFFSFLFVFFKDINKRLQNSKLIYEETSWFDTQTWEKPFFLIKNDKLISIKKIQPIFQKITYTSILLFFHFITFSLFL